MLILRCVECVEKQKKLLAIWKENAENKPKSSTREDMITWQDMLIGNFATNEALKEQINGMSSNQSSYWKWEFQAFVHDSEW